MSHLIDPCLRATKIAHGIRRGIDNLSPLSGLVPELRILIQEQKNVLTSLKRTAFEKEEAAKHLALYAKTEGPDLSDTLSKLNLLIQMPPDLERTYANSLGESRDLFKEVRVAEDENYSVRKRKLDLEQKLSLDKSHLTSTSTLSVNKSGIGSDLGSGLELHPEIKLLRQETMNVQNDLEDLKRKKIKKATFQQLDALERMGKELIVIAHYGKEVMDQLDDTLTPAGTYAEDRYAKYDGAAKTAYSVKACLDTFKSWPAKEPMVQVAEMDLGDFPKDTKQATDAMLQGLAMKSGSDWFDLQSPSASSTKSSSVLGHGRTGSTSSFGSASASPRNSMSSELTTMTYVDGLPMVRAIPPTPDTENGHNLDAAGSITTDTATPEPVPAFVSSTSSPPGSTSGSVAGDLDTDAVATSSAATDMATADADADADATSAAQPSPFVSQSIYKPSTTYQAGHVQEGRVSPSPPMRTRPLSGERFASAHAPHPLMSQQTPFLQQQHQQQQQLYRQSYPSGPPPGHLPTQMPMPMPMPMPTVPVSMHNNNNNNNMPFPTTMPIPRIPGSPEPDSMVNKPHPYHSQPISVSFPMRPPMGTSPTLVPMDTGRISPADIASPPLQAMSTSSQQQQQQQQQSRSNYPRNPHAVLPPTEPGFRIPVGIDVEDENVDSSEQIYDGPPPDYAEAAMQPPAELRDEKKKR